MGSKIFEEILKGKIESFVNEYSISSKNIFVKNNGNIIHPRGIWYV